MRRSLSAFRTQFNCVHQMVLSVRYRDPALAITERDVVWILAALGQVLTEGLGFLQAGHSEDSFLAERAIHWPDDSQ